MRQAVDFLTGKLGKFGDSAAQFAKNISVEGLQRGWDTYMVQSPAELARVAKDTMQRKNTVISNLDMKKLEEAYTSAEKSSEYITAFNNLKNNLNSGNIEEAKIIATSISERFQDGAYLKLLQEAEGKHASNMAYYDSLGVAGIKEEFKLGFDIPEKAKRFVTDKQQDKIANMAYKLQGKKQYFNSGDIKTNQVRAGVVGGAYLGGSMVVRGLQGGNPITNEYGERDIAGIPFI